MQSRIKNIWDRIAKAAAQSGRTAGEVTLVAVSKTVDVDQVDRAALLGIQDFGENRVPELLRKQQAFPELRWHMIGRLQTNKVKDLIGKTVLIHSLDRWSLARELNRRAQLAQTTVDALVQVNIAGEEQKGGLAPEDVESFLSSLGELPALRIKGLMTMAPEASNAEEVRPVFRELKELKLKLLKRQYDYVDLKYLSMGMSQDFEVAVEEGSNMVRIGSAIFAQLL